MGWGRLCLFVISDEEETNLNLDLEWGVLPDEVLASTVFETACGCTHEDEWMILTFANAHDIKVHNKPYANPHAATQIARTGVQHIHFDACLASSACTHNEPQLFISSSRFMLLPCPPSPLDPHPSRLARCPAPAPPCSRAPPALTLHLGALCEQCLLGLLLIL